MDELPEGEILATEQAESQPVAEKRQLPVWRWLVAVFAVTGVCAYLVTSGWGGYVAAYVRCGVRQPIITSTIDNAKIYYTSDHRRYSVPGEGVSFSGYYCDEPQAKAAGFLRAGP